MFAMNVPLILVMMSRLTEVYWNEEAFKEFAVGPSFAEVQDKFKLLDKARAEAR